MKIIYLSMGEKRLVNHLLENNIEISSIIEPKKKKNKNRTIKQIIKNILKLFLSKYKTLEDIASKNNIKYFSFTKKEYKYFHDFIKKEEPDLVIVYSMPFLIKEDTLNLAKIGFVNIHPSYLPEFRGPDPWIYQFLRKDNKFGYTIHFIDKGEDTGDIIFQEKFDIDYEMQFSELVDLFLKRASKNIINIINDIKIGKDINRIKQPKVINSLRAKRTNLNYKGKLKDIIENYRRKNIE